MEKIRSLLINYKYNQNIIDKELIIKVINTIIDEKKLHDQVLNIEFIDIDQLTTNHQGYNTIMAYNYFNKSIVIDEKKTIDSVRILENSVKNINYNNLEISIFNTCFLIRGLFHELEHANQQKKTFSNRTLEEKILNVFNHVNNKVLNLSDMEKELLFKFDICFDDELYNDLYINSYIRRHYDESAIDERLADIYSYYDMIDVLEPIKEDVPNLYDYYEKMSIYRTLIDYRDGLKITSPTRRYLNTLSNSGISDINIRFNEEFNNSLINTSCLSLQRRSILGLDITNDEYKSLAKRLLK